MQLNPNVPDGSRDRELAGLVVSHIKGTMSERYTVVEGYWPRAHLPRPAEAKLIRKVVVACGWMVVILFCAGTLMAAR